MGTLLGNQLGRPDIHPYLLFYDRIRYYWMDVTYHAFLWLGAWEVTEDPLDCCSWLNQWALFAFLTHRGWLVFCQSRELTSLGITALVGAMPIFWARHTFQKQH